MAKISLRTQRLSGLLGFALGALLVLGFAMPAQAQRMFDWFGGFGGGGFGSPQAPAQREREVDYSRAPAPKKPEQAPTSTVVVFGDSMADWLAYGLEDALADQPELGVLRKHRTVSGLIRYDSRNENLDWAQIAKEIIAAEKPQYIVMMLGLNDRQAIRERVQPAAPARNAPGQRGAAANQPAQPAPPAQAAPAPSANPTQPNDAEADRAETASPEQPQVAAPEPPVRGRAGAASLNHEFRSERWAELYTKKIDDTIAALKSRGVPVFWVGLPSVRGPKSTSDVQYLNDLYKARAEKLGITYIDVWDGFVDDAGRFVLQGPDFEGQIRRLRTSDGVHFTKAGARKLAHYVEREIRRSSTRGSVAVALPSSEPQQQTPAGAPKPGGAAQRPLNGPVMPLTAAVTTGDTLLGGGGAQTPNSHVTVTRVLVKGETVDAPAGRSDDFAWPRRNVAPFGTDPVAATTTLPIPQMQAAPAATTVPVPTGETPAVVATAPRRSAPRPAPQAQQQPRSWNNGFFFPFFR